MRFDNAPTAAPTTDSADWAAVKATILANLDVSAEYERLGVEFTRPANGKGIRECRAVGRKDETPSAFVNVRTGVYHDSGGEGVTLSLWDFALRYGQHGRWIDVMRHYGARAGIEIQGVKASKGGRIREAEYLYRDASGAVRYAVWRYRLPNGKKTFSQAPCDGKGGWRVGEGCMEGVLPLPYRLPELLASADAGDPVWVVEGEKDADRLASLGFVATTNHQGAGSTDSTWPRFLEHFRGRECYVIPDDDAQGRKHSGKVAAYLAPVAKLVKVVELPGLPPKGDVSDWLNTGHDVDELGRLAASAPAWEPGGEKEEAKEETTDAPIVWASQITPKKVTWLWPHRIPGTKLTTFAGPGGIGKTFVLCDIAARISAGMEWPFGGGEVAERGQVLFISGEDDADDTLVPRLMECGADLTRVAFLGPEAHDQFTLVDLDILTSYVAGMDSLRLVVVDPPTTYLSGVDNHKDAELRGAVLGPLKRWSTKHQVAVILNTHVNKATGSNVDAAARVMGSVAWVNAVRTAHMFIRDTESYDEVLFVPFKVNITKRQKSLVYKVTETHDDLAKVEWVREVDTTADDALQTDKAKPRRVLASEWLTEQFGKKREWPSDDLHRAAREHGISRNALFDAKGLLPIKARKTTGSNGDVLWYWVAEDGWPPAEGQDTGAPF